MCDTRTLVPIPDFLMETAGFDPDHPEFAWDSNGRQCFAIDSCIVPALLAVWAAGQKTLGCCCGHGQVAGGIITLDTGPGGYTGPRTGTQEQYAALHAAANR